MKKMWRFIFVMGMFFGSLLFGTGLFCRQIMQKEVLASAIQQMDMASIVKDEMGDQYELVGKLMDTKEFKDILASYTNGFIDYVVNGTETINVTESQLRDLLSNYSSMLLEQYPELSFLPTDRFIDFLVSSIDVTKILPSYDRVMEEVPTDALHLIRFLKTPWLVAGSLGLWLLCFLLMISRDISGGIKWTVILLLVSGMMFRLAALSNDLLFSIPSMMSYDKIKPVIGYLLGQFVPIATIFVLSGILLFFIDIIVIRRKGKIT